MQLVINSFGTALRVKDGLFQVAGEGFKQEIAPRKVTSIIITTGVLLSTDAVKLALENNIDVVFLNEFGDPLGRIWHDRLGSITTIRRRQLSLIDTGEGLDFVKEWIATKLSNQITLLEHYRKTRSRNSSEITKVIDSLNISKKDLEPLSGTPDSLRDQILGIEGAAGRAYFQLLSMLLPEKFQFEGRSRNPARDYFNCLLNYAYGVLYGKVERACVLAGLDPYIGLLHTDNYNKKSLVFDLIENFRIWAEETVMAMFAAREVKESMFDKLKNGFTLNKDGKAALLSRYIKFLEESIRFRNRNIKRLDVVQLVCHRIANRLIGKIDDSDDFQIVATEGMKENEGR